MAQNYVTVTLCIESDSVDVCCCVNSSLWLIHTVSKIADKVVATAAPQCPHVDGIINHGITT